MKYDVAIYAAVCLAKYEAALSCTGYAMLPSVKVPQLRLFYASEAEATSAQHAIGI